MKKFEDMTPGEKARYCEKRYAELKNEAELRVAEARSNKGSGGGVRSTGKTVKRSDEQLAEEIGESRNQAQRYLRLAKLTPELLELVDDGTISIMTAVEISFLDSEVQGLLFDYIMENHAVVSYEVRKLREYLRDVESINKDGMDRLLAGKEPEIIQTVQGDRVVTEDKPKITFTEKKLRKYFSPKYSKTDMENVMTGFLEYWKNEQDKEGVK